MGTSSKIYFLHLSTSIFANFGKDTHRKTMMIRLITFSESWIWDQYLSKSMNGFLRIWYKYLLQNRKPNLGSLEFENLGFLKVTGHQNMQKYGGNIQWLFSFFQNLTGPKSSWSQGMYSSKKNLKWWNLGNFGTLNMK